MIENLDNYFKQNNIKVLKQGFMDDNEIEENQNQYKYYQQQIFDGLENSEYDDYFLDQQENFVVDGEEFDGELESFGDLFDEDSLEFQEEFNLYRRGLGSKCPRKVKVPTWSKKEPSLQDQFDKVHPNPQANTEMKFTVDKDTFKSNQPKYYKKRRKRYRYPSMYYYATIKLDEGDEDDYIYTKLPKKWIDFNSKSGYFQFNPDKDLVENVYEVKLYAVNGRYSKCMSKGYKFYLDLDNDKPHFDDNFVPLQTLFEGQNAKTAVDVFYTFKFPQLVITDKDTKDTLQYNFKWKLEASDSWKSWTSDLWLQPHFINGATKSQSYIIMNGTAPFEDYYKKTFYVWVYGYDGLQYGKEEEELVYMWDFSNNAPYIDATKKVLQVQFNEQNPNPQVGQHLRFDITENPFFDPDVDNDLEYLVYYWDGSYDYSSGEMEFGTGSWEVLDSSQWIYFSQNGLYFEGTAPESLMDTNYTIRMNLTDQFVVSDGMYFYIDLSNYNPEINADVKDLQFQFDSQFPKPYLFLEMQMIFVIVKSPFQDFDLEDTLNFEIFYKENEGDSWSPLSGIWISPSSDQQMLIGTPSIDKLDTKWYIGYQVNDNYKTSELQSFVIDFTDNQPIVNPLMTDTVQEQFDAQNPNPQVGKSIELSFFNAPFIDADDDYLTYEVLYQVKDSLSDADNWAELVDEWIYFTPKSLTFKGTAGVDLMDKFVLIKFRCTDGLKSSEYLEFYIDLANEGPYIDPSVTTLQEQFDAQVSRLGIGSVIEFEIKEFPIVDDDKDEISYQVEYLDESGNWQILEDQWLSFTQKNRKFKGVPPVESMDTIYNLRLIGSDGYKFSEPVFLALNLTDASPEQAEEAKDLEEQINSLIKTNIVTMKVGKSFQFQFDGNTFEDSDSSGLNYNAYYTRKVLKNEGQSRRRVMKNGMKNMENLKNRRNLIQEGDYPIGYFEQNVVDSEYVKLTTSLDSEVWMKFNPKTRTFYGTPSVKDLGSQSVMVVIDDAYKEITQNFTLTITNESPYLNLPLSDQLQAMPVINTDFQFVFQKKTFLDPDEDDLSYNVTMGDGSALIEELKFDEENRRVFGNLGVLRDNSFITKSPITIKIIATDPAGMTAEDTLVLEVKPSVIYIIQLIIEIFGGLLSILSFIALLPFLHEILCRRRYEYLRRMDVKIDHQQKKIFYMQIPLIRQELKFGCKIMDKISWQKLTAGQKIKKTWEFKEWIFNYFDQKTGNLKTEAFTETVNMVLEQFKKKEQKKLMKEQKTKEKTIKKMEEKEKKMKNRGRRNSKKRTSVYLENTLQKTKQQIDKKQQIIQNLTEMEMINQFQDYQQGQKLSTMVTIFQGLFHKQMVEKNKDLKYLFNFIREKNYQYNYSINSRDEKGKTVKKINASQKDWYQNYITVGYTKEINDLKENKFPPLIGFDFELLRTDIQMAKQAKDIQKLRKKAKKGEVVNVPEIQSYGVSDFEVNIISRCIIYYAYGVLDKVQGFQLEAAFGESLHVLPKEIKYIKCQLRRDEKCYKVSDKILAKLSFLKMDYYDLSLKRNYPLPKWMQVQILHGVIRIQGVPQVEDIATDKFKFIIQDKLGYILKEFWVNVKGNQRLPKVQEDEIFQYIVERKIKQRQQEMEKQKKIYEKTREKEMNINGLRLVKGSKQLKNSQSQDDQQHLLQGFYGASMQKTNLNLKNSLVHSQISHNLLLNQNQNQLLINENQETDNSLESYDSQDYGDLQKQSNQIFKEFQISKENLDEKKFAKQGEIEAEIEENKLKQLNVNEIDSRRSSAYNTDRVLIQPKDFQKNNNEQAYLDLENQQLDTNKDDEDLIMGEMSKRNTLNEDGQKQSNLQIQKDNNLNSHLLNLTPDQQQQDDDDDNNKPNLGLDFYPQLSKFDSEQIAIFKDDSKEENQNQQQQEKEEQQDYLEKNDGLIILQDGKKQQYEQKSEIESEDSEKQNESGQKSKKQDQIQQIENEVIDLEEEEEERDSIQNQQYQISSYNISQQQLKQHVVNIDNFESDEDIENQKQKSQYQSSTQIQQQQFKKQKSFVRKSVIANKQTENNIMNTYFQGGNKTTNNSGTKSKKQSQKNSIIGKQQRKKDYPL
ncbi:Cadherin-like protein [Pseudocohnilembus persalinus]|uniref:Cadherin-like protein n=1 Tax=Pseudocohnilembus persalinus TaxID=266149 RepID=A0A0V0R382_PSEPJ|nr:Cadherin-like protein [Pseudocohnilembus persalinus]|eukprot:KRX08945.1 Cadherin-like protein [Pseudocohnilembus persalinus]